MEYNQIQQYYSYALKKYREEKDSGAISEQAYFKKCLIISRFMAQYTIDEYNEAWDKYNKLRRMKERFKLQCVSITTLDKQMILSLKKCKELKALIASLGGLICNSLDGWQSLGITYEDLYNFCCCSEKTISDMKKSIDEGIVLFSDLVCINYPDDKNKGDFVDIHKYAPLTHCVIEHLCEQMETACKDKDLRGKINNKLFKIFPEIKDCCLLKYDDEDGNTLFTDLDGLPVDFY